jgi:hypothetical protein
MVGGAYLIYFAWRWHYFGYPLPNTYYAKQGSTLSLGVGYVEGYLWAHLGILGVAGAALGLRRRQPWGVPVALVLGGGLGAAALVGGDIFPLHRFLVPIVPVAAACTAYLVWEVSVALRHRLRLFARVAAVVTIGAVLVAAPHRERPTLVGTALRGPDDWTKLQRNARITRNYERIARWIDRTFPDDLTLAINAAGVIPYRTRLRTIDMLGLTDEHIAHRPVPDGPIALGHAKSDPEYVLDLRPDLIIPALPLVLDAPPRPRDLMRIWTRSMLPGDREMAANRRFHRDYKLIVAQVDADGFTPLFVRRDRLHLLNRGAPAAERGPH